jgi:hypothetical protein
MEHFRLHGPIRQAVTWRDAPQPLFIAVYRRCLLIEDDSAGVAPAPEERAGIRSQADTARDPHAKEKPP